MQTFSATPQHTLKTRLGLFLSLLVLIPASMWTRPADAATVAVDLPIDLNTGWTSNYRRYVSMDKGPGLSVDELHDADAFVITLSMPEGEAMQVTPSTEGGFTTVWFQQNWDTSTAPDPSYTFQRFSGTAKMLDYDGPGTGEVSFQPYIIYISSTQKWRLRVEPRFSFAGEFSFSGIEITVPINQTIFPDGAGGWSPHNAPPFNFDAPTNQAAPLLTTIPVPEPSSMFLLAGGACMLLSRRIRNAGGNLR